MFKRLLAWLGHPREEGPPWFRKIIYLENDAPGEPKVYAKIYWTPEICDIIMAVGMEFLKDAVRRHIASDSLATLAENVKVVIGYSQHFTGRGLYTDPTEQEWEMD